MSQVWIFNHWLVELLGTFLPYRWGHYYSFTSLSFLNIWSPWEPRPCSFQIYILASRTMLSLQHLFSKCSWKCKQKLGVEWLENLLKVIYPVGGGAQTWTHNSWLLTLCFFSVLPVPQPQLGWGSSLGATILWGSPIPGKQERGEGEGGKKRGSIMIRYVIKDPTFWHLEELLDIMGSFSGKACKQ